MAGRIIDSGSDIKTIDKGIKKRLEVAVVRKMCRRGYGLCAH